MDRAALQPSPTDIAVIGMAGRFPGARNLHEFWDNLSRGVESITTFSERDLRAAGIEPALLTQPGYVNARGVLSDVDLFDASFFGFNPREAEVTDPQHRVLLECAWEALEDAGYDPGKCDGSIGVYAGAAMSTYLFNLYSHPELANLIGQFQLMVANDKDHLTTRLAYKLNLRGPAITVQTACSTSLVAVALACQSLVDFQCDLALAGGVSIQVPQEAGYFFQDGGIGSPDGHCRAFDAAARGTVPASGVGLVLLKRLSEALADGDAIRAVIKGAALNNDGSSKVGYTAPSVEGQAEVIALAQATASIEPRSISYIEAHGTGTSLGDPIEVAALTQVFRAATDERQFCALGSLKTNVGHLDPAAGIGGLIKTILALEHGQIPPSLHYHQPNPKIDFANSPFYVNTALSEWPRNGGPRRAGVSSFGIGGTNAHVVLEEAPVVPRSDHVRRGALLLLSARTTSALEAMTSNLAAYLRSHPATDLCDAAWTLQQGRRHFTHRRVLLSPCGDVEAAAQALEMRDPGRVWSAAEPASEAPIAFLFPGQGAQHVNMARELYDVEPFFREAIDACAALLAPSLGLDLRSVLYPDDAFREQAARRLTHTSLAQPALFVVEYALAKLLIGWGVKPAMMLGHSLGEYVAACLADVMSLDDALDLVAARGRLMGEQPAGAMLAVGLAEAEVLPLIPPAVSLAAVNAPSSCVVSGPMEDIVRLEATLTSRGVGVQRLHTSHAFHSAMMEPAREPFLRQFDGVRLQAPRVRMLSNVTGTWADAALASPAYWAKQLRATVRFDECIRAVVEQPGVTLVEIGPGRTLSALVRQSIASPGAAERVIASLPHAMDRESAETVLLTALGRLWLSGVRVDWAAFQRYEDRRRIALPTYPFERQRYWVGRRAAGPASSDATASSASKRNEMADWFYVPSWRRADLAITDRGPAARPQRWLVLDNGSGLGAQVVGELRRLGHEVVVVRCGDQFKGETPAAYEIHPEQRDHYRALLQELQRHERVPDRVVHLLSIATPEESASDDTGRLEGRGFKSLLAFAQGIGSAGLKSRVHMDVVSDQVHAVTGQEPSAAVGESTIIGPCRVIPQEYPWITCRNIDLPFSPTHDAVVAGRLVAELVTEPVDSIVAYRGDERWLPVFERVQPAPSPTALLREHGVYVITGGFGGIGRTLAMDLATSLGAKLVLIGRSPMPERDRWVEWLDTHAEEDETSRRIRQVHALEKAGAEVLTPSVDAGDLTQMERVFAEATARFGRIHGLIHAAGVAGGGLMQLKTPAAVARVMQPKVAGARVIERLIAEHPLDFVVLCSSLSALVGGVGQVDYCAANAFLDAFAERRPAGTTPIIAVDWDVWRDVGMAVTTPLPKALQAQRSDSARLGIRSAEGATAFREVLGLGRSRVVVSTRDLDLVLGASHVSAPRDETAVVAATPPEHERPSLAVPYAAPRDEVEQKIADVWQQLLGVDRIGIHDGFFDLGGHSLLAIQVISRLNDAFATDLSIETLFDAPTVAGLAEIIETRRRETPSEPGEIDELLEMVEGLSDDEVKARLATPPASLEESV